ncbi:MAG: hypothetical protein F6K47_04165 [Symploca sp. SIO2E6]|nr:hypothetical protein [Symploca sp. SIO2E6]
MTKLTTEQAQQARDLVARLKKAEERLNEAIAAYNDALIGGFGKWVSDKEDAYNSIAKQGNALLSSTHPDFLKLELAWVELSEPIKLNPGLINWQAWADGLEELGVGGLDTESLKADTARLDERQVLRKMDEAFLHWYEQELDVLYCDNPAEELTELAATIPWEQRGLDSKKHLWLNYGIKFLTEKARQRNEDYDEDEDESLPFETVKHERSALALLPPTPEPTDEEIAALRRIVRAWVPDGSSKDWCEGLITGLVLYPQTKVVLKDHLISVALKLIKEQCSEAPYWR